MKVVFTGTRHGMNTVQKARVIAFLQYYQPDEAHHGCCVGADKEFHDLVRQFSPRTRIIGHPSNIPSMTADCDCDEMRRPLAPLTRNRVMVDEMDSVNDELLAAPLEAAEILKSGTWSTWRYAKKQGKRWLIAARDGLDRFGYTVEKQAAE